MLSTTTSARTALTLSLKRDYYLAAALHTDTDCKSATDLLELLHCFVLTRHVNFPAHSHAHILDQVCSSGLSIHQPLSLNHDISNHLAITMDMDIPLPTPKEKCKISYRNLKSISLQLFQPPLTVKYLFPHCRCLTTPPTLSTTTMNTLLLPQPAGCH